MDPNEDYYLFFEVPEQFWPDMDTLRERYYQNVRRFHPDQYASDETGKERSLLVSAMNNRAWKCLSDFESRVKYLLMRRGLANEDDRSALPQEFLMDMLDLNDEVMSDSVEERESAVKKLEVLEQEVMNDLKNATRADDSNPGSENDRIREAWQKLRFIRRLIYQANPQE